MKLYAVLIVLGVGVVALAALVGGRAAGIGGTLAVIAQTAAVALLRPALAASQPVFMSRWLGGGGIPALGLSALLAISSTHPQAVPFLPPAPGYLPVVFPLLFTADPCFQ